MARYIDADKLCESLKNMAAVQEPYKQNTILGVVSSIENFPTADVVPKSEVENIFAEIEKSVASKIPMKFTPIFKRDLDYDAGVIDGKHDAFYEVLVLIAEHKKKYTEGGAKYE